MSIELPGWTVDVFNLVGLPWPGIDEDQLRAWATGVRSYTTENASTLSWKSASSGSLEEGGPGGGWREVARAVEQTALQVLKQLFVDLGRALWTLLTDTVKFLKKAIQALRHTDGTLAADARGLGPGAALAAGGTGGWTGAGHIEGSSPEAEAAYEAIRNDTGDVSQISANTGISENVIEQVKKHFFLTEHDVPVGPGDIRHGYFTADEDLANLWNKAAGAR